MARRGPHPGGMDGDQIADLGDRDPGACDSDAVMAATMNSDVVSEKIVSART